MIRLDMNDVQARNVMLALESRAIEGQHRLNSPKLSFKDEPLISMDVNACIEISTIIRTQLGDRA